MIQDGYVAFGDSYASGMGAGETHGRCRRGAGAYPVQLAATAPHAKFEHIACAGAHVDDLLLCNPHLAYVVDGGSNCQIDMWRNPETTDLATLSIGGNDLGFYHLINACVVRIYFGLSGDCDEYIRTAQETLRNGVLAGKVVKALDQILEKSRRSHFQIVMTGYAPFFNANTTWCNNATFDFWRKPHHGRDHHHRHAFYLSTELRHRLNNLVTDLNALLAGVADIVNGVRQQKKVLFVDPTDTFDEGHHRWCEPGVAEPDKYRKETWWYLSGWNDVLDSKRDLHSTDMTQAQQEEPPANVTLPDAKTCDQDLKAANNHDPEGK